MRIYLALTTLIFLSACGSGDGANDAVPRPVVEISGQAGNAALRGAALTAYLLNSDGSLGEVVGSTTTDNSTGFYSVQVSSPFRPIALCVQGDADAEKSGYYVEPASGAEVRMGPDDRLCVAFVLMDKNPVKGIAINRTTNDAYALAQFSISTGLSVGSSVRKANSLMDGIMGFSVVRTVPVDFTSAPDSDLLTAEGGPVDSALASLVGAAVSEYMVFVGESNETEVVHSTYTSMLFSQLTYTDLIYDARHNGQGESGLLSLGTVPLGSESVRHDLATNLFVAVANASNQTGIDAFAISGFAQKLSENSGDIFGGEPLDPLNTHIPVVANISVKADATLFGEIEIAADFSDLYGVSTVDFSLLDSANVLSSLAAVSTGSRFSHALDTLAYADGPYTLRLEAANAVGGVRVSDIPIVIDNNLIVISNIQPLEGSFVRGKFQLSLDIGNVDPISSIVLSANGETTGSVFSLSPFAAEVDSALLADGVTDFQIKSFSPPYSETATIQYTVDNTPPVAQWVGLADGDTLPDDVTLEYLASDLFGVDRVSIEIEGVEVFATQDPTASTARFSNIDRVDGAYNISLLVTDTAQNISTHSLSFYVDRSPPAVTTNLVASGAAYVLINTEAVFNVYAEDANPIISVKIMIDNVTPAGLSIASVVFDGALSEASKLILRATAVYDGYALSEGFHTVEISATDASGKVGEISLAVVINARPPVASVSSISNGVNLNGAGGYVSQWWRYRVTFTDNVPINNYVWDWVAGNPSRHFLSVSTVAGNDSNTVAFDVEVIDSGLQSHALPGMEFKAKNSGGKWATLIVK